MLNPFPILFLALLAHALLRIVTGTLFCVFGFQHINTVRVTSDNRVLLSILAAIELVLGACFIAGFSTQFAALGTLAYLALIITLRTRLKDYLPAPTTRVLLFGIALSLFITGAGAFAVDMPF